MSALVVALFEDKRLAGNPRLKGVIENMQYLLEGQLDGTAYLVYKEEGKALKESIENQYYNFDSIYPSVPARFHILDKFPWYKDLVKEKEGVRSEAGMVEYLLDGTNSKVLGLTESETQALREHLSRASRRVFSDEDRARAVEETYAKAMMEVSGAQAAGALFPLSDKTTKGARNQCADGPRTAPIACSDPIQT